MSIIFPQQSVGIKRDFKHTAHSKSGMRSFDLRLFYQVSQTVVETRFDLKGT